MEIKTKLRGRSGMSRLTFLLLCGIAVMLLLFIAEGYIRHLDDAKMTFDKDQVREAVELAKIQYLSEGCPAGTTYYYDAERARMVPFDEIGNIVGYGRSSAAHNRHGETGALGIPNLGGRGGAQFLAIAIEDDNTFNVRWQGKRLTVYDESLMSAQELARLTEAQRLQIELDRQRGGDAG